MGLNYTNGDDETNNRHLAEAIDLTREGSAQPGSAGYEQSVGQDFNLYDSALHSAIEALQNIDTVPAESQEKINEVVDMLRSVQHASVEQQSQTMVRAHGMLQEIWVPPSN